MRVAISGASGLAGGALTGLLRARGHDVVRLVRPAASPGAGDVTWDPANGQLNAADLEGVDAIVNLSGENLGSRWTEERKREFRSSRVLATALIARTIASMRRKPKVLVSASAMGIYGADRGSELLDEHASEGSDFLAMLCRDWEASAAHAAEEGVRVVLSRTGLILSPDGGVLEKLLLPFRLGAGGKIGSGDQWTSWIALTDFAEAVLFILETPSLRGPVNVATPNPVTNEQLVKELGHVLHRPTIAAIPATVIRLMIGREMADLTVLASQRMVPKKLVAAGFTCRFPLLSDALRHELKLTPS